MREKQIPLQILKRYTFEEQIELFRGGRVRLPPGVEAQFIGSGVSCTYDPEKDNSCIHSFPIVGTIVEFVRGKQFPESPCV